MMSYQDTFTNIRSTKLLFYLRYTDKQGIDSSDLFANTSLSRRKLESPHALVETHEYIQVVSNMMRLTQMPDLAFRLGEELRLGDLGILGHAVSAGITVGGAIELWLRHNWLFFGSLFFDDISSNKGRISYTFIPRIKLFPHLLQFFIEEKTNVDIALFSRFNGVPLPAKSLHLSYSKPPHSERYEELFGISPIFDSKENKFVIDATQLNPQMPLPGADRETAQILTKRLDEMALSITSNTTVTAVTRSKIKENLPKVLSVEEFARKMNFSARTLVRRLQAEGSSYQQLLQEVRSEMAKNFLSTTSLKIDELAEILGFHDAASFRRAFKSWTGVSVSEYLLVIQ